MKMKNLLIEETIPERSFFKPQEVSALLKVKPHELRYWESEFSGFKGHKTKHGLKLYRREEVLVFASIRHLLHEKKFTIAAAKQILKDAQDFSNDLGKNQEEDSLTTEPVAEFIVEETAVMGAEPAHEPLAILSNQVLHEASEILLKADGHYDEKTHALYEELGKEETIEIMEELIAQEPLLSTVVPEQKPVCETPSSLSLEDRAKAMVATNMLKASKESLQNLLVSLDRFKESSFWDGTFTKR